MHTLVVVLRLLHVTAAAFWAGVLIFNAVFLGPAVRDAGPPGGLVMGALIKRRITVVMPVMGLTAVLSGVWLYYINSVGFQAAYMKSGHGMTFGIGGVAGIAALIIAAAFLAPSLEKAAKISQQLAQAGPGEKEQLMAMAQALRVRAGKAGVASATLGGIALVTMSIARYM